MHNDGERFDNCAAVDHDAGSPVVPAETITHEPGSLMIARNGRVLVLISETLAGTDQYRISEILIVDPLDTGVLEPTDADVLTLITCYPFYYVGYAPDRYIVRGVLDNSSPRRLTTSSGGEPTLARGVGPRMESDRI